MEMMMQETEKNLELVSALADGQLGGEEFARTVEWLGHDEEASLTWHAYHLVGDVLRSGETMVSARDIAFSRRLKLFLQREVVLAPSLDAANLIAGCEISKNPGVVQLSEDEVANDAHSGWKLLAGFASLVAVAVIGWQAAGSLGDQRGAPQLAQAPLQTGKPEIGLQQTLAVGADQPPVMIRDPQLDALLAAHRQSGGTSVLQMSAGFLRNATFEGTSR